MNNLVTSNNLNNFYIQNPKHGYNSYGTDSGENKNNFYNLNNFYQNNVSNGYWNSSNYYNQQNSNTNQNPDNKK
jgi:hypothetical protein